jgi:hypothetical protein
MLNFQRVPIDPHGYLFSSRQPIFPEEFPVLEPDITMCIDVAGELSRIQGPRQHFFGDCATHHPAQDFQWAVSPVLALPMGVMFFLACRSATRFDGPAESPARSAVLKLCGILSLLRSVRSLHNLQERLSVIHPGFTRLNALFTYSEHVIELESDTRIDDVG